MSEKVTGYVLLTIGLIIILFSSLNVFQVFTKRTKPVEIFDFPAISFDASALIPTDQPLRPPAGAAAPQMELIPKQVLNESSNLFIHLFLMGFVVSVGYKISSLGVLLIRPIKVTLKEKVI